LQTRCSSSQPHFLTPGDLNDFTVIWIYLKNKLKSQVGWYLLYQDSEVCSFRNRQNEFKNFFYHENVLAFCKDVCSVIEALRHQHDSSKCRLFIDSSNFSLKALVLHNGNKYPSVSLAHAANTKNS
jgi:hypothetical protein